MRRNLQEWSLFSFLEAVIEFEMVGGNGCLIFPNNQGSVRRRNDVDHDDSIKWMKSMSFMSRAIPTNYRREEMLVKLHRFENAIGS